MARESATWTSTRLSTEICPTRHGGEEMREPGLAWLSERRGRGLGIAIAAAHLRPPPSPASTVRPSSSPAYACDGGDHKRESSGRSSKDLCARGIRAREELRQGILPPQLESRAST